MSPDTIVNIQNILMMTASLPVAVFYFWRFFSEFSFADIFRKRAARIVLGVGLTAGGLFLHRGYWFVGRWARENVGQQAWELFADNAAYTLILPVLMIVIGYALHMYDFFKGLSRCWWCPIAMFHAICCWAALQL